MRTQILLWLLPLAAFAGEPVSEKTNYTVDRIIPGYSVRMIDAGFPLGRMVKESSIEVKKEEKAIARLAQERDRNAAEVKTLRENGKHIHSEMKEAKVPEVDGTAPIDSSVSPVTDVPVQDLDQFSTCAKEAIAILKTALAVEYREGVEAARKITLDLDAHRADGQSVSPTGLACGRYLGKASILRPVSTIDEIKVLMALSAREGEEREQLLTAFVASHKSVTEKALSPEQTMVWVHYWNRLSALAALSTKPLPTFEALENELLNAPADQLLKSGRADQRFEVRGSLGDMKLARSGGLEFVRRILQ